MNIFAKVIIVTDNNIKTNLINKLNLVFKEEIEWIEIFSKKYDEWNLILIYSENKNFSKYISYAKENYEILKIVNIWTAISMSDLDVLNWDIMIPNTFIDENGKAIFIEWLTDKNFDLNKFWLHLNWICLTKKNNFKNEDEVFETKEKYSTDILDFESYFLLEEAKKNDLIDKIYIIKIIWNTNEEIKNWIDILELMI